MRAHDAIAIADVLLNQRVVAGIGNVYADESLHHSRIYPGRHAGDLSQGEIGRLRTAIRTVLSSAVETAGTSFAGYVNDFRGQKGYLDHAEAFRRQGQPCLVCGTVIVRTTVAGRAANFCPRCQQP